MIFVIIFIRIYRTKLPDPTYTAKVILIIMQTLVLSSMIKVFMTQVYGAGYIEKLIESGNMKMVYLLPIIPCSIFTHFFYTEQRVDYLKTKYEKYSNLTLSIRMLLAIGVMLALIFFNSIVNAII